MRTYSQFAKVVLRKAKILLVVPGVLMSITSVMVYADTGTYTVSGTVTLGSQAATGVAVSAGGTGTADINGNYVINNVPNGSYPVGLNNGGSVPCDQPSTVCNESIAIAMVAENNATNPPSNLVTVNGANVTQNFNLPATVPVSVTVNNSDGTPASGVAVSANSGSGVAVDASNSSIIYTNRQFYNAVSVFANANTGSDGTYTLYMIPGYTYGICGSTSGSNPLSGCTSIGTLSSATSAVITLPAPILKYTVSGTVKLGSQAASNVDISAGGTSLTDSNGNYSVPNVLNGSYPVIMQNGGSVPCDQPSTVCDESIAIQMLAENSSTNPPSNLLTVNGANVTQNLNLPGTVPVTITVNNGDGTPASGAAIVANSSGGTAVDASNSSIIYTNRQFYNAVSVFANANTGSDGKYTLYLIPGFTYGICASTSGTNPLNGCTSIGTVNSATSATITFPSQNVGFTVSGNVKLGSQAATGVVVSAGGNGTADSNGNYTISNVANGSYSVGLNNGGSVPCDQPSSVCNESIAVAMVAENNATNPPSNLVNVNGANITQNFNLPATVPVSITVDNADGTPASGVSLVANSGGGVAVDTSNSSIVYTNRQFYNAVSVFANTNTGSDGKYTLYLIPGYTYAVCGTTTGTNPLGGCTSLGTVSAAMSAVVTVPLPTPLNLVSNATSYYPSLSWTGANLVNGADYVIYRDGTAVGTSTTPLFTDTSAPSGTHSYLVKVNANGYYGLPSNTIQVTVAADTTPPTIGMPTWSTNQ